MVDVTALTMGGVEHQRTHDGAWGGGYGITQGVVITAKRQVDR